MTKDEALKKADQMLKDRFGGDAATIARRRPDAADSARRARDNIAEAIRDGRLKPLDK